MPLILFASLPVQAGGLAGGGAQQRIEQETIFAVWDHQSQTEHLLIAARATGLSGEGAYLVALPRGARLDHPLDGIPEVISKLLPTVTPLESQPGSTPAWAPRPGGLVELCKTWKLTCHATLLEWSTERFSRQELALIPLTAPSTGGSSTSAYTHFFFDTKHALIPFAEPDEDRIEPDPPLPGPDHPPRIQLFLELYNETPTGRWERQMDQALEQRRDALVACYSDLLKQQNKLSGNMQIQGLLRGNNSVEEEESQTSSKPFDAVARCFAKSLHKAPWPKNPFQKPIRFVVHATLRPPAATPRRTLIVLLSTQDLEPRLGHADIPRVIPDLKSITNQEPDPEVLRQAFPEAARQALGLDLTRRWRLIAFETGVDPHGVHDDIEMRPLVLPSTRPGAAPMPILSRGDRPDQPRFHPPTRWWKRRRVKQGGLVLVLCMGIGFLLWRWKEHPTSSSISTR